MLWINISDGSVTKSNALNWIELEYLKEKTEKNAIWQTSSQCSSYLSMYINIILYVAFMQYVGYIQSL